MTNTKAILQRNDARIEGEINRLEAEKNRFVPFFGELQLTGLDFTLADFQQLAKGDRTKLTLWLKEKTVSITPQVNDLPITQKAKIDMIALKDYSRLYETHASIPHDRKHFVFSFDIAEGQLVISETARTKIIDNHTDYGDADAVEVLKICNEVKEALNRCVSKFGFNPLNKYIITPHGIGNDVTIHISAISSTVKEYREFESNGKSNGKNESV